MINNVSDAHFWNERYANNDIGWDLGGVTPVFKDWKNGQYKIISFFAKKARGAMAAFVIKNKIKKINDLKDFNDLGYIFNKERSDKKTLVFIR